VHFPPSPNPAFERDAAKARRPSILRSAAHRSGVWEKRPSDDCGKADVVAAGASRAGRRFLSFCGPPPNNKSDALWARPGDELGFVFDADGPRHLTLGGYVASRSGYYPQ